MPAKRPSAEHIQSEHVKRVALAAQDADVTMAPLKVDPVSTEQVEIEGFQRENVEEISDLEFIPCGFDHDAEIAQFIDVAYKRQDGSITFRYRIMTDCHGIRKVYGFVQQGSHKIGSMKAQIVRRGYEHGQVFWEMCDGFSKDLSNVAAELFDGYGMPTFEGAQQELGGKKGLFIYIDEVKMDEDCTMQDVHLKFIKYFLDGLYEWGLCVMVPYFGVTGRDLKRLGFRDCGASFMAMYLVRSTEEECSQPGGSLKFKPIEIRRKQEPYGPLQVCDRTQWISR